MFLEALALSFSLWLAPHAAAGPHAEQDATLVESVVVQAIKADDATPVSRTDLGRAEIERLSVGQELPFLLAATPSVNMISDTGTGAGYSYLYLRGIQQTRINFTFDGVPLNEPEDGAAYFVNYANAAASLQNIQVQRGVGTSTFGAAAFAGSVGLESVEPAAASKLAFEAGGGSYGTRRLSLGAHSGELGRFRFYGRGSWHDTDGYRDHSGVTQGSFFFGATARGERSSLRISGFVGREETQLAFLAVEPAVLAANPRANPLSEDERDRFTQGLVQATWTRALDADSSVSVQGYYHAAGGWYRIDTAGALRQYDLDWGFAGLTGSFTTRPGASTRLTLGAHVNDHHSRHARAPVGGASEYVNYGDKSEASAFAKLAHELGRVTLFADAQVRRATFDYRGAAGPGEVDWSFFNPKLGLTWRRDEALSLYASAGATRREPQRADLFQGADDAPPGYDLTAVRPERVVDFEAGGAYRRGRLALHANAYAMFFEDEIALTGELSEIGLPLRRNVDESRRVGLELEAALALAPRLRATLAAAFSRNRIESWTQYFDVYDETGNWIGSTPRTFDRVEPLLTPELIASAGLTRQFGRDSSASLGARYVGTAFLDNTNAPGLTTPSFTLMDASVLVGLGGGVRLRLQVDNLLDEDRVWPTGYAYQFAVRDAGGAETFSGTPYYYPLAERSVFVGVEFGN